MKIRNISALIITLLFLGLALIVFFIKIANTSLPPSNLRKELKQVDDTVTVMANHYGVNHVLAKNRKDAFFTVGFLHARDRMWQMDLLRRFARGQLSEIFGSETISLDRFLRQLNISSTARKMYSSTDKNSRLILESYAEGVNHYLKAYKTKLHFEFNALDYIPEKWVPEDSYAIGRLFAFIMSSSFTNDISFGRIAERIGTQKALDLIPAYPANSPLVLDDSSKSNLKNLNDSLLKKAVLPISGLLNNKDFDLTAINDLLNWKNSSNGSNSWVYRKSKDPNSGVILTNDPHLSVGMPATWYQMHLTFPGFNVTGMMVPGTPLFYAGRNDNIAWGITSSMADDCDFFIEKIDSTNQNFYFQSNGKREKFKFVKDTIKVRNETPIYYYKKLTTRSAVISEAYKQRTIKESGKSSSYFDAYCLTFSWTGNITSNDFGTLYRLNTASDWASFSKALNSWVAPALCFTYADRNKNLGVIPAGLIPKRRNGSPNIPNPAYIDGSGWDGYIQLADAGKSYNPSNRFIVSANQKLSKASLFISNYWEPPSRAERITELLKLHEEYSIRDAQIMQSDVLSVYARQFMETVTPFFESIRGDLTEKERNIIYQWKKWDYILSPLSNGASMFTEFYAYLLRNTFSDELGEELFKLYTGEQTLPMTKLLALLQDPGFPEWFNDVKTVNQEFKNFILLKSFRDAVRSLEKKFDNPDFKSWAYGELHQITFNHTLSKNAFLEPSVNIGPFRIGGNAATINNTNYNINKTYDVTKYASMRFVTDMDENFIYTCLPGGQSGDPQSPNYRDQIQLWLNGGFIQLSTDKTPGLGFVKKIVFYPDN